MYIDSITTRNKRRIILNLLSNSLRAVDLAKKLSISRSSVSQHLKELEKLGIVEKGPEIRLTNSGKILGRQIQLLHNNCEFLRKNVNFWNDHDLSSIPEHLLIRIHELGDFSIVNGKNGEILGFINHFESVIDGAEFTKVITSITFPGFVNFLSPDEIIVSEDVEKTVEVSGIKVYVAKNLKLFCVVTDKGVGMGFHLVSGDFDVQRALISYERSAIEWAVELFESLKFMCVQNRNHLPETQKA